MWVTGGPVKAWPVPCGRDWQAELRAFQPLHAITIPPCPVPFTMSTPAEPSFCASQRELYSRWQLPAIPSYVKVRCRFLTPSQRNVHTARRLHTSSPIEYLPRAIGTWAWIITSISSIFLPVSVAKSRDLAFPKVESCPSVRVARVKCVKCSSRKSQTPWSRSPGTSRASRNELWSSLSSVRIRGGHCRRVPGAWDKKSDRDNAENATERSPQSHLRHSQQCSSCHRCVTFFYDFNEYLHFERWYIVGHHLWYKSFFVEFWLEL